MANDSTIERVCVCENHEQVDSQGDSPITMLTVLANEKMIGKHRICECAMSGHPGGLEENPPWGKKEKKERYRISKGCVHGV